jgi:PAS domain S-box-containing protein
MNSTDTTGHPLLQENTQLRQRIAALESDRAELDRLRSELQREKDKYQTAFEHTGTAMMMIDENRTVLMGNHRLEEVTGYPQEAAFQGRTWSDYVDEQDIERLLSYDRVRSIDPAMAPVEYEYHLKHKSGETRDILMNVGAIPGTQLKLISLIDITERKVTEQKLSRSERMYRDLFENANDIIYTHDLSGNFLSINAAAVQTYGYSREEMQAAHISVIVDPASMPESILRLENMRAGIQPPNTYELLTRTKSGDEVWIEVRSRIIEEDGQPHAIQGIARNITDRKKAELKLQESERRFREMSELLPCIICELNFDLYFTYINRYGLESFGYNREEFERGIHIFSVLHPDEIENAKQSFTNIIAGEKALPHEYRMLRHDGTVVSMLANSAPIMRNGKVVGLRSCVFDITAQKQIQAKLGRSEERFRRIFAHSPIGLALFVLDGRIFEKNSSFDAMFRITTSRQTGIGGANLFSFVGLSKDEVKDLSGGAVIYCESTMALAPEDDADPITLSPSTRHFAWHITRIGLETSDQALCLAQVQDVTERKTVEAHTLQRARQETEAAERVIEGLKREILESNCVHGIVSASPAMKKVLDLIPQMAHSDATVLIRGESGTGKELVARALHENGVRAIKPFIAVNCTALPDNLFESELFGYKAGAFTDAKKDKPGRFAMAEGGTLFIDEIGDLSLAMQVKLLRIIQEKTYEPLGGSTPLKADVRILTATNKDLDEMVQRGEFREDLFYRINVLALSLPPLRDRKCDIPLLCDHFIAKLNLRCRKEIHGISQDGQVMLLGYSYPGNIRELENILERAYFFCNTATIGCDEISRSLNQERRTDTGAITSITQLKGFEELERYYISSMLMETGGNKLLAAKRMGIHKATLFRKLKQLEMIGEDE